MDRKVKVGIRGIAGLLGKRLAREIRKQPDMEIAFGILRCDSTLEMLLSSPTDLSWMKEMPLYLDDKTERIKECNESQKEISFKSANTDLNLKDECDILIDAASPGTREKWDERYRGFKKPVIIQSGEYPYGRLVSPPLIEEGHGNIYRQGGCILSGVSPVLAALKEEMKGVRIHVLMQYDKKLNDFPTNQKIHSIYLDDTSGEILRKEVQSLLNGKEVIVEGMLQVPGLDYYVVTFHLDTKRLLNGKVLREYLESRPRINIAPENFSSTYEIDHLLREQAQAIGKSIPPIVVYGCDLDYVVPRENNIRLRIAIYSRMIAVLQNIDAIRMLANGTTPVDAMKITDEYAGFV